MSGLKAVSNEEFNVQLRSKIGGGAARALRRSGLIPGILYGEGQENISFSIDPREVEKKLTQSGFYTKIFKLNIGEQSTQALAREVQFHPVTDRPLHIDFWRVGKNTKIHVAVPLVFINENKCPGLKLGGSLNIVTHNLEVTCSVASIPEQLIIDLEGMELGTTFHLEGLELPAGVVATHPERDHTLATLLAPKLAQENETAAETPAATAPTKGAPTKAASSK